MTNDWKANSREEIGMNRKIVSLCIAVMLLLGTAFIPQNKVDAADPTITWKTNGSWQEFEVTNNLEETIYYSLYVVGRLISEKEPVESRQNTVIGWWALESCEIILYNKFGAEIGSKRTETSHGYTVYAQDTEGNALFFETDDIATNIIARGTIDSGRIITVQGFDDIVTHENGKDIEWVLTGSKSQTVRYGTYEVYFIYARADKDTRSFTVRCVDENGAEIRTNSVTVPYDDGQGAGSYNIDDEIILDNGNRIYRLKDATKAKQYMVGYYDVAGDVVYEYELQKNTVNDDYLVTIEYRVVDEDGRDLNVVLGMDTFTYNDNNTTPYKVQAPESISVRNDQDGSIYYYKLYNNADGMVVHQAGDGDVHQVYYVSEGENTAYVWKIYGIDVETGTVLYTDFSNTIMPGANAEKRVETAITVNGKDYILDVNASNVYYHTYDSKGKRETYIPYHEADVVGSSYDVTIQYVDVKTFDVIESKTVSASAKTDGAIIEAPVGIKAGDISYVRIQGQVDKKEHKFYMPQRTYSIFYRDINDLESADITINEIYEEPVIVDEFVNEYYDVVTTGTEETTPQLQGEGINTTPRLGTPNSLVVNDTTGETTLVDEEGVPLAESIQNVEDQEVPLGSSVEDAENSKGKIAWVIGVSLVGLVILLLLLFYFFKKSKTEKGNK